MDHLLRDGRFAVRALTRKPAGFQAQELMRAGATVVEANFDNPASLCSAFEGCYGAFGVTDYFEAFEREAQQGINMVEAAKAANLKHLVIGVAPPSENSAIESFKYKIIIYAHLKKSGVPYTAFMPTFYYGNIFLFDVLTKTHEGDWMLDLPFPANVPIPCLSPKDIGAYVLSAFTNPSEWIGNEMRVCNELVTPIQFAKTFAEVTGTNVKVREYTREEFLALEHAPYFLDAWGVFKLFIDDFDQGNISMSPKLAQRLHPTRQTWRDFLIEHREVPVSQPLMIECLHTRERFGD